MAVDREYRRIALTPLEAERIKKHECPICGCPRESFKPRNRNAMCCCPDHSKEYWNVQRPTRDEMRTLVYKEQEGKCPHCKQKITQYDYKHPFVLDHIIPIAMGGDQWDRKNLQVLCEKCNKWKTARDMGNIATHRQYPNSKPTLQKSLFEGLP